MVGQSGFCYLSVRCAALNAADHPLERYAALLNFKVLRGPLGAALRRSARGNGGQPTFDPVLMLKILVLQAPYSLSDEAIEVQIKNCLSFNRFFGLGPSRRAAEDITALLFRERLVQAKAIDKLFARLDAAR